MAKDLAKEKHTFEFLIAGVPYKLKTSHDEKTVKELVQLINHKMTESMAVTKNGSYQNAAVLTALNLAEELMLLKRASRREIEKIEDKMTKLFHDLESSKSKSSEL